MYADDYNDSLYVNSSGEIPNDGQWTVWRRDWTSLPLLNPNDGLAYWGVAYAGYIGARAGAEFSGVRAPRRSMSGAMAGVITTTKTSGSVRLTGWLTTWPATTRRAQPNVRKSVSSPIGLDDLLPGRSEQAMEGADDSLGLFPGSSAILTQWLGNPPRPGGGLSALYNNYDFQYEWYRHNRRCQTMWVAGNVSLIHYTGLNKGVDYRWYTGDLPAENPK